ncbi:ABC transporter ATP-binding protein [Halalkalibacillus sediminis]|uniref:ABC transporter ATP-binding protein n=1 Tax=Halalkalibacillus sediminis TaxID=2018042 RepID=A0A2I0QSK5_9BACI|nr:ABC transporter ATP-binding protein [Halalkalibacillus sediminis]PKR77306.1 ABC transporter ATP-binding protein [Halalkalibacillus sediminis]
MSKWVEINEVSKKIDEFHLGPINLSVEPGTITCLVGSNGAGKSTLLKMMAGLVSYDDGSLTMFNEDYLMNKDDWKQHVSYMPQSLLGCDPFNGHQLKELISTWYPDWDEEYFNELVDLFEINLNKKYGRLSPGGKQRLNIALTLPRNTKLLLLDEPTSHIDIPAKAKFMDEIVRWMDKGERSIIMSSHQADDIKKLADYLVLFHEGMQLGTFEKEELTQQFQKYWMQESLPHEVIPGEIDRKGDRVIISQDNVETEEFFKKNQLSYINREPLSVEEIITVLLDKKREKTT